MPNGSFGEPGEVLIQVPGGPDPVVSSGRKFFTPIRLVAIGLFVLAILIAIVGFQYKYGEIPFNSTLGNFITDF